MTVLRFSVGMGSLTKALAAVLILASGITALPADEPPNDKPATDDQLMKSLGSELLNGLEIPAAKDDESTPDDPPSADATTGDVDEFTRIGRQMRKLERMLPQPEEKPHTVRLQKEVIGELDKLIANLEKQCQRRQSGSSSGSRQPQQTADRQQVKQSGRQPPGSGAQNPSGPARESTERLGKDEVRKADMEQMKGLLKDVWGQLPEKAREQMLQSSPEQFLPKYELLIEDYYRKLAEKKPR